MILNGAGGSDTLNVIYASNNFAHTLTLNGGAGNDILQTTGTATAALGLTINGGDNDDSVRLNADITFAADASLSVDLQDDSATPGIDSIAVGSNANMILSGTGAATLKVSSSVQFNTGSSLVTANGDILIEANQQSTASTTNFTGITVNGATLNSGAGTLTLKGRGGINDSATNSGVRVQGASLVTSTGGNVSVSGIGGGTSASNSNSGVIIRDTGKITAGGLGTVAVVGVGGDGNGTDGVNVQVAAGITSAGGNIQVTGTKGAGNSNGIFVVSSGSIVSVGTASITLISDNIGLSATGAINGLSNTVTLRPLTSTTVAIGLGVLDTTGVLGLTDLELDQITAGTLVIGDAISGSITLSQDITRTASTNVQLITGGGIIQNSSGGSFNTGGATLLLTHGGTTNSHQPNRTGTDLTASTVSYAAGSDLSIDISGTTVNTGYTQLNVTGTVDLANVALQLTGSFTPAFGNTFVIVSATAVSNAFSNYAEGQQFTFNTRTLQINYTSTAVTLTDVTAQSPALTTPGSITYTENDPATPIAPAIVVADVDSATLASATVTITNFVSTEDVLSFDNDNATMGNIALLINTGGVLTLSSSGSSATKLEWQSALRAVKYANTSNTPDTTQRLVDFVINDGALSSAALTSTINVTATDDAPELTIPGSTTFTENGPAAAIAAGLVVTDIDSATLAGATVTITNFFSGEDVLSFVNDNATMGNIAVVTNVGGVLTLTSSGSSATKLEWQSALRAVKYANTSDSPHTAQRSVDFVVNDGTSSSTALTSTISLITVADIPTVTNGVVVAQNMTAALPVTVNAADGGEVTHFKITNIINGRLFKSDGVTEVVNNAFITAAEGNAGLRFLGTAGLSSPTDTFSFDVQGATSNEGDGLSTAATSTITVVNLEGIWFINGLPTHILQNGSALTFINEYHDPVQGRVLPSGGEIIADGWEGGLHAQIAPDQIAWGNHSTWTRPAVSPLPVLQEEWDISGLHAHVEQRGAELILTNEFGDVSRARFVSPTQLEAIDWNNLVGTLSNGNQRIDWENETAWSVPAVVSPAPADVSGAWLIAGEWTQIRQSGRELTLINERGDVSSARLSSDNLTITANIWNITGQISGGQINWSNDTVWTRATFSPPALSHVWTIGGGLTTQLDPNDGELLLTSEFGETSRAVFLSSTEIFAVGWNLRGTLSDSNSLIDWSNDSQWSAAPSDIDALFSGEFNPFD